MVSQIAPSYCCLMVAILFRPKFELPRKWSFNYIGTIVQSSIDQRTLSIFCTITRFDRITLYDHPRQVALIPIASAHDANPAPHPAVSSPGDYLTPAS